MKSQPHHKAPTTVPASSLKLMGWYVAALAMALLFFLGLSSLLRNVNRSPLVIPDEKSAAAGLLARELSGPRYFQIAEGDLRNADGITVKDAAEPHISTAAVHRQLDGIIAERQLNAEGIAKLRALVDKLNEEPRSRLVGEAHINLLRLNLALDALQ